MQLKGILSDYPTKHTYIVQASQSSPKIFSYILFYECNVEHKVIKNSSHPIQCHLCSGSVLLESYCDEYVCMAISRLLSFKFSKNHKFHSRTRLDGWYQLIKIENSLQVC